MSQWWAKCSEKSKETIAAIVHTSHGKFQEEEIFEWFLKDNQILSGKEKSIPCNGNRMYQSRQQRVHLMGLMRSFTKFEQRICEEMSQKRKSRKRLKTQCEVFVYSRWTYALHKESCKKSISFSSGYSVVTLLIISYLFIWKKHLKISSVTAINLQGRVTSHYFVLVAMVFVIQKCVKIKFRQPLDSRGQMCITEMLKIGF